MFVFFMARTPSAFAINMLPLLWRGAKSLAVPRRVHDSPFTPETDPAQLAHQLIHTSTVSHQKPACYPPDIPLPAGQQDLTYMSILVSYLPTIRGC